MKTNKKLVMCCSVIAAMAVAGVSAFSSLTPEIKATGENNNGVSFTNVYNKRSTISGTLAVDSYWSPSGTGDKYWIAYKMDYSAGGTGYGSGALAGYNSWLAVTAASDKAQTLTCAFFMNGIRTIKIGHEFSAGATNTISFYTSTTGYSASSNYDTIPFSSYDATGFAYDSYYHIDSDGSKNIQAIKFEINVPANTTVGITVSIDWTC
ncbi:MAG: hypothetical protein LKJ81_03135 [Bacilli bacterium]|jgi:hypothetical protein|nr:hypothetical protein [Bacilli bacterium]MCH4277576.1 hypothetical protein [Bacilli bacterium]MCI2055128.1 hypothetical protein [Bacilli bacterium]